MKNPNHCFKGIMLALAFLTIYSCDSGGEEIAEEMANIEGKVATYAISSNSITLTSQHQTGNSFYTESNNHEQLWSFFTSLIPLSARPQLVEFELFVDPNDDTEAFVAPINNNDLSAWEIGYNMSSVWTSTFEFQQSRVAYNSIHEFAHVLTLDNRQINVGGTEEGCDQFFAGEGCSMAASYINQFFQNYWTDIYDESQSFEVDDDDAFFAFYDKYSDRFVTEYASTNPGEDIAESFTSFVLKDRPSNDIIKNQKINFFYDFEELVELRTQIRSNIDFEIDFDEVGEARLKRLLNRTAHRY